jgi:inorganic pyrophosphatase
LLTVPIDTTFPYYARVAGTEDLPEIVRQQVEHFFTHYKDLEPEKWVRVGRWGDAAEAKRVLLEAIERARASAPGDG